MRPQSSMEFGDKYLQAQECGQRYVLHSARVMPAPTSKSPEIQEPLCGAHSQWRSAYKRESTSTRSRSWSARDSASTRRNACCSIAWKNSTRRPRIFSRVGQRLKITVGHRKEDNFMQNGQLRTSCCSRVIHQFWSQFVVNIDIA